MSEVEAIRDIKRIIRNSSTIVDSRAYIVALTEREAFLEDFNFKPTTLKSKFHVQVFKFITNYPHAKYYRSRIMMFFSLISLLCNRVWHFLINKDYRKYVIKHRKRIYTYQKSKF